MGNPGNGKSLILANRALSIFYNFLKYYKENGGYIVLLPANICHDIYFLVLNLGMPFYIIDIEEDDFGINKKYVSDIIKKGGNYIVLYNHTYGVEQVPYLFFKKIKTISEKVIIVDDRCLCSPSLNLSSEDEIIDLIVYSTGYSKQVDLGGSGFGFIGNELELDDRQIQFNPMTHNVLKNAFYDDHKSLGSDTSIVKSCFDIKAPDEINRSEYFGAISSELEGWNEHKKGIREIYLTSLPDEIQLPDQFNNWRFNILVNGRDMIVRRLFKDGLFCSTHYPAISYMLNAKDKSFAHTIHQRVINLFIDKNYNVEQANRTVEIIRESIMLR